MLQKGFLKHQEDSEKSRTIKKSRIFFIVGTVVIFSALMMMFILRTDESFANQVSSVRMAGIVMIAGIILISVGFWMNFFIQNKNRRKFENRI